MSADNPGSLAALLPNSIAAIVGAQARLDAAVPLPTARFHLTSIPSADFRFEFGLTFSERHGFIPRRTNSRLQHVVSFNVAAVPDPIDPPAGDWTKLPLTLFEPAFMVDPEREIDLGLRVCWALQDGRGVPRLPDGRPLESGALEAAGKSLQSELLQPNDPDLGVLAFHLSDRPATDLVVVVTDDADRDGVFVVEDERAPVIYSIPGDDCDAVFYEPLHRLTMAMGAWLAGKTPARRAAVQTLPRHWGFTTLEFLAGRLATGYQESLSRLAQAPSSGPLTQHFDVAQVCAEIAFGIRQDGAPRLSVTRGDDRETDLVAGLAELRLARAGQSMAPSLTLVSPGFVLTAGARAAFLSRAEAAAQQIARQFREDHSVDYLRAIQEPPDPERIVVMLSVQDPDHPFKYLVTWPVETPTLGGRHFVFRCEEDGESLHDIEPIMRASDSLADVAVIAGVPSQRISGDVYEEFHRFFRAARVWRSGVAQQLQHAALRDALG